MTLIIKSLGATAPEGAKKLYRDALVEDGTLFLVDFSNKGTLDNFSVRDKSIVYDLAREAANSKGISTTAEVRLDSDIPIELTEGKGFTLDVPNIPLARPQGMFFDSSELMNHLATNQPHCVWVGWCRIVEDTVYPTYFRTRIGTDDTIKNIRANILKGAITPTFGGEYPGSLPINPGELIQFAVEFQGVGQKVKGYINKVDVGTRTNGATGFVQADDFVLGMVSDNYPNPVATYRTFIEDLDLSGRTVQEILEKDWDYVHAQGQFEGIVKRPFVDKY